MELKNAVSVCLISFCSATLVVLIARSLDSQAASRLEPQLVRIVEELQAIRSSGGFTVGAPAPANSPSLRDGLVVYYFHSNTRCPTCRAIESQSQEAVQAEFPSQLESGKLSWKTLNYEEPSVSELAAKFEIQMPIVVLASMKDGQIERWTRLDKVWGLVNKKPAFAAYVRDEIRNMLNDEGQARTVEQSVDAQAIPIPGDSGDGPLPTESRQIPVPQ